MTYFISIIELDRPNQPNDLVRLLGGGNCFHIRKHAEGVLKKLKPLEAIIVSDKEVIGKAPENVIKELVNGGIDIGDPVEVKLEYKDLGGRWYRYENFMGNLLPEFYSNRTRPRYNDDGTVMCEVTPIKLRIRSKRA